MWYVYILLCSDNTLYTGISNNPEERLKVHEAGKGAKYTKGRSPLKIIFLSETKDRSEASREEYRIKCLTRDSKILLIDSDLNTLKDYKSSN
jgi:putative endonuclease